MKTKVQKWGNSLALRIPRTIAVDLGLTAESTVDIRLKSGRFEVTPVVDAELDLGHLLEQITEENLHGECDTGQPVGREEW